MAPKLPQGNFATLPTPAKVAGLFLILALLTAAYYLGEHMGLEEQIQGAVAAHDSLQHDLDQAKERQKQFLKLSEELNARMASDRQNMRILPESAEIPAFLDDLNRLAELSGLRVVNVGPRPEKAEPFFVRVPVSLQLAGKYHQLAKFFYNISRLERAINMENIGLTSPTREGEDIVLSVSVLATTFRRPDAAKVP